MLNMASRFFLLLFLLASLAPADPPTMFPPVRGTREMVGAANNFEVEAGFRLLTAGGNAVDAGVAFENVPRQPVPQVAVVHV